MEGSLVSIEEVGQNLEKQRQHDSTMVILLPGVLSPKISMFPLQRYLKHNGFTNTTTVGLNWSIGKFDELVDLAVKGIKEQVQIYKSKHDGNIPQDLVIIGYSNGGSVGAKAIEVIKEEGLTVRSPKLITLATPAKAGEKSHPLPLRAAFSLTDSYRHPPDVTFPEDWISVYSPTDDIVDQERTFNDEKGNKPQELVATNQGLSHFQMIDPRKTGSLMVNLLDKITANKAV